MRQWLPQNWDYWIIMSRQLLPNCHYLIIMNRRQLPNCHHLIIMNRSMLPNWHYLIIMSRHLLPNWHYSLIISRQLLPTPAHKSLCSGSSSNRNISKNPFLTVVSLWVKMRSQRWGDSKNCLSPRSWATIWKWDVVKWIAHMRWAAGTGHELGKQNLCSDQPLGGM